MSQLSQTTAAVFAGGLGTRLRSAVADRPKVLAEVEGRPFLAYLLDQLVAAGTRKVVLCTGYMAEQVAETFGDAYRSLELAYSREESPLGTGGALRLAADHFESDPVLVLNGDSYCTADLTAFRAWHADRGARDSMVLCQVPDVSRYGQVVVDEAGAVTSFREKGGDTGPGWINAGVYLFSRELVQSIPSDTAVSLEKEVMPARIGNGLYGQQTASRLLDIGTPASYAAAARFFAGELPE